MGWSTGGRVLKARSPVNSDATDAFVDLKPDLATELPGNTDRKAAYAPSPAIEDRFGPSPLGSRAHPLTAGCTVAFFLILAPRETKSFGSLLRQLIVS